MAKTIDLEKCAPSTSSTSSSVHIPTDAGHSVPFIPASLTVSNLQYEITVKDKANDSQKSSIFKKTPNVQRALLSNITTKATPGRVLAIMGPSGSGKTTLLDLLADRQARNVGKLQGEILLNDVPIKEYGSIRKRLVGYVTQEDDFIETLTVLETLTFAAKMRLPRSMSNKDKLARVDAVMQELNLTHIKDTKVGGAVIRGISGGEKRRVTIGIELLSSPSVLLLDEPTSGLSSTDALNVANAIKELAHRGRTVILTVHQPRSDIYELFDDLLLLSQGKVVYFGQAQTAAAYFEGLGHECPVGWNVADYFLDLITLHQEKTESTEEGTTNREDFAQKYASYITTNPDAYLTQVLKQHQNNTEKIERDALLSEFKKQYTTQYAATSLTQTLLLTQRSLTNLARHPTIFQASAVIHIIFALVIGSLFSGLKDRPEMGATSFNKSIALFFITSFLATMTFSAMPQFIIERSLFLRERAAGMYRTSSYFMAKTIVETLSYTILSVIFVVITYYLIGLHGSLIYYFVSVAVFVNVALSLIAAIGAGAENAEVGMNLLSLINTMAMLFSGFIVSRTDIPRGWIWAFWASYYQWAFSGLLGNEFSDGSDKGTATLAYFGMDHIEWLTKWRAVLILLGYYIFFRIIGLLLLLAKKA
ncbi:P-loop containing nucleoside triphosphate hydrolase protein [Gamsiella multidivaricata]|uniref:P-loop containing nucleoside triphosphate hydrolase protein n=1 Tax=Gamsiella multidivaricata TaxID=101098 RepID=UPI0022205B8B|nr:P-loop containing nucleoside triphosphate hydrolase protein [Gamsiella multidivaricata]KAI7830244.1 P-loop containing nucleoside triphosphate hydrolase protein [Gamsiella multidivaricata]